MEAYGDLPPDFSPHYSPQAGGASSRAPPLGGGSSVTHSDAAGAARSRSNAEGAHARAATATSIRVDEPSSRMVGGASMLSSVSRQLDWLGRTLSSVTISPLRLLRQDSDPVEDELASPLRAIGSTPLFVSPQEAAAAGVTGEPDAETVRAAGGTLSVDSPIIPRCVPAPVNAPRALRPYALHPPRAPAPAPAAAGCCTTRRFRSSHVSTWRASSATPRRRCADGR